MNDCFPTYPPPHREGVCCMCDHVRDLDKLGYYDFMKPSELSRLQRMEERLKTELRKRIEEETAHINHPKQIYKSVQHNCEYNKRVCEILLIKILEDKK